jgi:radical SAM superfamily enzyme YgiQ (UPF0313 family)
MKRILLIWPNMGRLQIDDQDYIFADKAGMEPLPLAVIASLIPNEYEVILVDDRYEEIRYNLPACLVCISIEIFTARRGYEIADEYIRHGAKVLLGGIHVSLMPEEAKAHASTIFIGDIEPMWNEVMNDLQNNTLKSVYNSTISTQLPGIYPRRNLYKKLPYLPYLLLQFGRGCQYSCNFCAIAACFKQTYTTRTVHDVIQEIEFSGRKLLFFVDDNIIANPRAAKELFRALIPLKIKWVGQASIDMAQDDELLNLMSRSGCLGHVVGFESVGKEGLFQLNKQVNLRDFDHYQSQIKKLYHYGIQIWAALVIGHDADTPETIEETLQFVKYHKFAFAAFNILMPYPGTPFFERLRMEDRLLFDNKWWLHPDYKFNEAAFIPRNFTPEGLTKACQYLRNEYNSYSSIFMRVLKAFSLRRTLSSAWFLAHYSYLFRTETQKKQFLKLG